MFNSGPSGFYNAPLSKALMIITAGASVLVTMMNSRDRFNVPALSVLTQRFQFWRLFTNNLFFNTPGETLFGLILIYSFRLFERQMGTSKFGAFTLLCYIISTLLHVGVLTLFPTRPIVSGPYSFIFACLVLFHYTVPITNRFRFLRLNLNDKVFTYLLGLQLLLSHSWSSVIAGAFGFLSGVLYTGDIFHLRRFTLPNWVNRLCSSVFLPFLQSPHMPPTTRSRPVRQPEANANNRAGGFGHRAAYQPAGMSFGVPVTEDNIGALTSMGFSREIATQALQQSNNNLQLATNILLDSA
eukprot:TRINITY_DN6898_c0_g1_i1.p1 TRINITY_DN6898_c0_g1~~TRINITY_DN6898_c0_g1_i1.p1  ORF type:complete len:298 (-),score=37.49 TRINITY_DN6898_c0_g1_i1:58-951(-)